MGWHSVLGHMSALAAWCKCAANLCSYNGEVLLVQVFIKTSIQDVRQDLMHHVSCKSGSPLREHEFTPMHERGAVTLTPRLIISCDPRNSAQPATGEKGTTVLPCVSWRQLEGGWELGRIFNLKQGFWSQKLLKGCTMAHRGGGYPGKSLPVLLSSYTSLAEGP